ncbi:MAG TPA: helix-turn-helix transcriptional regulator [Thermoanaerobaculia bacterium]|nr:helix-turn-helix transcriptional regulator [Thermoanaerobaculia bacterium]
MASVRRVEAVELLRLARGWTQRELADAADVRGAWLADHERGERRLDPETERRLVAAMEFPPDALERVRELLLWLREAGPAAGDTVDEGSATEPEERTPLAREVERVAATLDNAVAELSRLLREFARRQGD